MPEPEFITIVEGPTPEFRPSAEFGIHSILEGPTDSVTAMCELRTLNGKAIVARCQQAWKEGRPVRLDFPDHMRMRQELDIAALRLSEIEEGPVLQVWVWQPATGQYEAEEEADEDDDRYSY
jgi:hypothetical protein